MTAPTAAMKSPATAALAQAGGAALALAGGVAPALDLALAFSRYNTYDDTGYGARTRSTEEDMAT